MLGVLGKVFFHTIVHHGAPIEGMRLPFAVVAVELAEQDGLRYLATMVDCRNEDIRCDMPVEMTWIERGVTPFPAFRPASSAA